MDIKGYDLDLWQYNVSVVVPVLVSSRGYGLLWDNMSLTRFGDLRAPEAMPRAVLLDEAGKPGGLTGHYFAGAQFEKAVATRLDDTIDIQSPARPRPTRASIPTCRPKATSASAGTASSCRRRPAITRSTPFRTRASRCGSTAAW